MESFFHVGTITSPHGVRGDVKVYPTTDEKERFLQLDSVYLRENAQDPGRRCAISQVRFLKNLVLLHLAGISDRNGAEKVRGWELYIPREKAVPLQENEYYIADLIGMEVYTEREYLGILTEVLQTGANDVYQIATAHNGEILIPAIKECVQKVDIAAGRMEVHLLPGLLEEGKEVP